MDLRLSTRRAPHNCAHDPDGAAMVTRQGTHTHHPQTHTHTGTHTCIPHCCLNDQNTIFLQELKILPNIWLPCAALLPRMAESRPVGSCHLGVCWRGGRQPCGIERQLALWLLTLRELAQQSPFGALNPAENLAMGEARGPGSTPPQQPVWVEITQEISL